MVKDVYCGLGLSRCPVLLSLPSPLMQKHSPPDAIHIIYALALTFSVSPHLVECHQIAAALIFEKSADNHAAAAFPFECLDVVNLIPASL